MSSKCKCRLRGGSAVSTAFLPVLACVVPDALRGTDAREQLRQRRHAGVRMGRLAMLLSLVVAVGVTAGCSTLSGKPGFTDKLALQEKVDERMTAADQALKQGQVDQALAQLDGAIHMDPAAKQPWLKKAQIHFEARQYGLAITEAQEVLQRDVRDLTAQSILAVSGLRVSAQALEQLRKVNEVSGSTRSEAESVARLIHEALGEPILLSNPVASSSPVQAVASTPTAAASTRARATAGRPRAITLVGANGGAGGLQGAQAAPVVASPVSQPVPTARNNPFGALQ